MSNKEPFQLDLFDSSEPIETGVITPTKEMPLELFRVCHHLAFFMELMERLPDGRVLWNKDITEMYSSDLADAEYYGLQQDWFSINMELPKAFIDDHFI